MKVELDLDEIVGLTLEFAESHHITVKAVRDMNNAYDVRNPTEQEKIQFLRTMLPLIPVNSYLLDIIKKYLAAVDAGEIEYANAKMEKVNDYLLEDGGLIIIYKVKSTVVDTFYVATFDDGDDEVIWGCGEDIEGALEVAKREWDHFVHDENPDENPFTQALNQVQS